MSQKKTIRSTQAQLRILVEYMATHQNFANGEFLTPLGHRTQTEKWAELKEILKEYGPDKSIEQWRNTGRDIKKRAREEGAKVRRARGATGNHIDIPKMSDQSHKVLSIIGFESAFGIEMPESGIGEILEVVSNTYNIPAINPNTPPTIPNPLPSETTPSPNIIFHQPPTISSTLPTYSETTPSPNNMFLRPPTIPNTLPTTTITSHSETTPNSSTLLPPFSISNTLPSPSISQNPITQLPPTTATSSARKRKHSVCSSDFLKSEQETQKVLKDISNTLDAIQNEKQLKNQQLRINARRKIMETVRARRPILKF